MSAIIFDTETTDKHEPQIIEAGWLLMDTMTTFSETFEKRYRPSKPIAIGAMATHHIIDDDLVDCESHTSFALPEGVQYLIGHKIDFDWMVVGSPDVKRICTLAIAQKVWPDAESHSLSALTYMLSKDRKTTRNILRSAHSALTDVKICHGLLLGIYEAVGRFESWEALWQFSEAARIPDKMPFGKHAGVRIADVPADYKRWALANLNDLDPYLRKALAA